MVKTTRNGDVYRCPGSRRPQTGDCARIGSVYKDLTGRWQATVDGRGRVSEHPTRRGAVQAVDRATSARKRCDC